MSAKKSQTIFDLKALLNVLMQWFKGFVFPSNKTITALIGLPITKDEKLVSRLFYWSSFYIILIMLVLTYSAGLFAGLPILYLSVFIVTFYFLLFVMYPGLVNFFANRWLGGRNTFSRLLYSMGSGILIPAVLYLLLNFLAFDLVSVSLEIAHETNKILLGYTAIVNIQIIRNVYRFGYLKAIFSFVIILFGLVMLQFFIVGMVFGGGVGRYLP